MTIGYFTQQSLQFDFVFRKRSPDVVLVMDRAEEKNGVYLSLLRL